MEEVMKDKIIIKLLITIIRLLMDIKLVVTGCKYDFLYERKLLTEAQSYIKE